MCGLAMLALTTIEGNYQAYLLFVWIYGKFDELLTKQNLTLLLYAYQVFLLAVIIIR